MSVVDEMADPRVKRRVMYGAMILAGLVFVSSAVLPMATPVAQLVAALAFGLMSGLWLGHLIHSI